MDDLNNVDLLMELASHMFPVLSTGVVYAQESLASFEGCRFWQNTASLRPTLLPTARVNIC